jgi:tetrapyrrole methylase family protein / MazG family protein
VIGRVVVVGLGPAGDDLVSTGTLAEIDRHDVRFVRTTRHPSAPVVGHAESFDALYERAATIDEVYRGIVDALVEAAAEHGEVLYAVPGSPVVAEHTVELLLADDRVEVELRPALSFLDLAWVRLGVDPVARGVRIVDGHRFATEAAGERGPLLVAQCDRRSVLSDIKLAVDPPPTEPVLVLQGLGSSSERIFPVAWTDLDREVEPDHLTSLWIPRVAAPVAGEVGALVELVARLREECPWDREQTHRSLAPFLIEETYEVVEVLDALPDDAGSLGGTALDGTALDGTALDDAYADLEAELGDLLFQIVLHARLSAESGRFDLADVARGIHDKLVSRHPHVFGDVDVAGDPRQVEANWEQLKAAETGRESAFDGIPAGLPALARAAKVLSRARRLGLGEEVERFVAAGGTSTGAALLALVLVDDDPETALRDVVGRLEMSLRSAETRGRPPA